MPNEFLIYVVMGLLVLLGLFIALEKPKNPETNKRRYTLLMLVVVAEVVCLIFALGLFSLLFGGC